MVYRLLNCHLNLREVVFKNKECWKYCKGKTYFTTLFELLLKSNLLWLFLNTKNQKTLSPNNSFIASLHVEYWFVVVTKNTCTFVSSCFVLLQNLFAPYRQACLYNFNLHIFSMRRHRLCTLDVHCTTRVVENIFHTFFFSNMHIIHRMQSEVPVDQTKRIYHSRETKRSCERCSSITSRCTK